MLFLTRTPREGKDTILIGDDIRLVVRSVTGKQVSIGIEAPRDVKVLREEVPDRDNGQ